MKPIYNSEGQAIKAIGTEVLKQKLKNILGQANQRSQPQPPSYPQSINTNPNEQPKL